MQAATSTSGVKELYLEDFGLATASLGTAATARTDKEERLDRPTPGLRPSPAAC